MPLDSDGITAGLPAHWLECDSSCLEALDDVVCILKRWTSGDWPYLPFSIRFNGSLTSMLKHRIDFRFLSGKHGKSVEKCIIIRRTILFDDTSSLDTLALSWSKRAYHPNGNYSSSSSICTVHKSLSVFIITYLEYLFNALLRARARDLRFGNFII